METITNLNQFKEFLKRNINTECFISNLVYPERSRKTKVIHAQSNSFVLQTNNPDRINSTNIYDHSWTEFGSAKTWLFKELAPGQFDATKFLNNGAPLFTIEFRKD